MKSYVHACTRTFLVVCHREKPERERKKGEQVRERKFFQASKLVRIASASLETLNRGRNMTINHWRCQLLARKKRKRGRERERAKTPNENQMREKYKKTLSRKKTSSLKRKQNKFSFCFWMLSPPSFILFFICHCFYAKSTKKRNELWTQKKKTGDFESLSKWMISEFHNELQREKGEKDFFRTKKGKREREREGEKEKETYVDHQE